MADIEFQSFVDEVVERNDILEVISEYTKPKRVGSRFAALCPLHNDKKSPSLSISPDKQLFHCFGCGVGGNVIHFIQAAENLDFMDALRLLAERVNMPFPEFNKSSGEYKAKSDVEKKQLLYQINSDAGRYFYSNLVSDGGKEALRYLHDRGIKNTTIKMFGMGYAPKGYSGLIEHLKSLGYKEHDMYEAGVAKVRDNGTYFDAFNDGRIMIPYFNVSGKIIGFGGRIIEDNPNTGKYLNTAETLIFKKKENLFGLNFAKNDKSGSLLLMEGYMDVISLHQAGICNAVASCGTAFTEEQARLLKRYGKKAVLCYDSDEAGRKATERAGAILMSNGIKAKVLTVTGAKDPDEFIQKKGREMFLLLVDNAKPLIEYRIDEIQKQYTEDDGEKFKDSDSKIEFTQLASAVLSEIKDSVEYEIYLKRVSEKSGVSEQSLDTTVNVLRRKRGVAEERQSEQRIRRLNYEREKKSGASNRALYNAERLLLCLMCDKSVFRLVSENKIEAADFSDGLNRRIAEEIYKMFDTSGEVSINLLLDLMDESERGEAASIILDDKFTEDKKKACIHPIEVMLDEKGRKEQEKVLEKGDLKALDEMLRNRRK